MILTDLSLTNWRNHEKIEIHPSEGLNAIVGDNGAGKTNLAEAIYYLSLGRTWRGLTGEELIRKGKEEALLLATLKEGENARKIEIRLQGRRRTILLNGKPIKRLSDLSKVAYVIAFSPQNTSIFSGPPADRRSFLDLAIAKEDATHLSDLNSFLKLLGERNAVLKGETVDEAYLSVLTDQLVEVELPIIERRTAYLKRLEPTLKSVATAIFGKERPVTIAYEPFVGVEGYKEKAKALYQSSLGLDKIRGTTTYGIHKEDFSVMLDEKEVGTYGSQGENRILSLAMHLTPYFLIKEKDKKPIVVLDDVYSELDETHASNLTALLKTMGQVFITTTNSNITNASVIEVKKLP